MSVRSDKVDAVLVNEGGWTVSSTWRWLVTETTGYTSSTTLLYCTTSSNQTPEITHVTWPTWPPHTPKQSQLSSPVSC